MQRFPALCRARQPDIAALIAALGIQVEIQADLKDRARWVRFEPTGGAAQPLWTSADDPDAWEDLGKILLRPDASAVARRFLLAHELGHAMMFRDCRSATWSTEINVREIYANEFAREVLIPPDIRPRLRADFRSFTEPQEVIDLARYMGVPIGQLLAFAAYHPPGWLGGSDQIWIDVRHMRNTATKRMPRLRVNASWLDVRRWFIPRNRSVENVVVGVSWHGVGPAGSSSCVGAIRLKRIVDEPPFFRPETRSARLSVKRIHPVPGEEARFLVGARLS
jgi:hypothetical protein